MSHAAKKPHSTVSQQVAPRTCGAVKNGKAPQVDNDFSIIDVDDAGPITLEGYLELPYRATVFAAAAGNSSVAATVGSSSSSASAGVSGSTRATLKRKRFDDPQVVFTEDFVVVAAKYRRCVIQVMRFLVRFALSFSSFRSLMLSVGREPVDRADKFCC